MNKKIIATISAIVLSIIIVSAFAMFALITLFNPLAALFFICIVMLVGMVVRGAYILYDVIYEIIMSPRRKQ